MSPKRPISQYCTVLYSYLLVHLRASTVTQIGTFEIYRSMPKVITRGVFNGRAIRIGVKNKTRSFHQIFFNVSNVSEKTFASTLFISPALALAGGLPEKQSRPCRCRHRWISRASYRSVHSRLEIARHSCARCEASRFSLCFFYFRQGGKKEKATFETRTRVLRERWRQPRKSTSLQIFAGSSSR